MPPRFDTARQHLRDLVATDGDLTDELETQFVRKCCRDYKMTVKQAKNMVWKLAHDQERMRAGSSMVQKRRKRGANGCFKGVEDAERIEMASARLPTMLNTKEIKAMKGICEAEREASVKGLSAINTGNDAASVTEWFHLDDDMLADTVFQSLGSMTLGFLQRLKSGGVLGEAETARLERSVESGDCPKQCFVNIYAADEVHGLHWHVDNESGVGTLVILLATGGNRRTGTGLQIHPGNIVEARDIPNRAADFSNLKVGDAVFFRTGTVHRVPALPRRRERVVLCVFL